jgi:hypothetical protein
MKGIAFFEGIDNFFLKKKKKPKNVSFNLNFFLLKTKQYKGKPRI